MNGAHVVTAVTINSNMDSSKPSTNFDKQLLLEYYFMAEHKNVIRYRFCYVLKRIIKRSDNGSNVVIATTINSDTGCSRQSQ